MIDTKSFIAELKDTAVIELSGEQRYEYLHGQLTVATNQSQPERARLAAHCDFKGKMFSMPVVSEYGDSFLLTCQKESAAHSLEQLKKYGVFSKVDISVSNDFTCVGVTGEDNIKLLTVLFPTLTNEHMHVVSNDFGQAICFNDTSLRYLCHLSSKGCDRLHDISEAIEFVSEEYFAALEIEAGIANIQENTVGQFVPQMLNLHCLNAIDFDKGCYMGQEVVARTKFLGKNKRASFILKGSFSDGFSQQLTIDAGDTLEINVADNWRKGGTVLRASSLQIEGKTQITALAVMSNDTLKDTLVRVKGTELTLSVCPLPYTLE